MKGICISGRQISVDFRRGVSEPDELVISCRPPFPNVLVVGSFDDIASTIARVWSCLQRPITYWDHGVPATIQGLRRGTLVIFAVEQLPPAEQDRLYAFIGDRGRAVQVISAATVDPFEQVRRSTFAEGLYYRLNTIRLHSAILLGEHPMSPRPRSLKPDGRAADVRRDEFRAVADALKNVNNVTRDEFMAATDEIRETVRELATPLTRIAQSRQNLMK